MPEDESQLRNLLPLLAQLQQGSLSGVFVEEVGDVGHCSPIFLRDVVVAAGILTVGYGHVAGGGMAATRQAAEMLVLLVLRVLMLVLLLLL